MIFRVGDHVSIDRLGMPFHNRWGEVVRVESMRVWVALYEYTPLNQGYVKLPPLWFETWELRLIRHNDGGQ